MNSKILLLFFILLYYNSLAQIGGEHVYEFMALPNSARVAALGGMAISVQDGDVALGLQNPALLNSEAHKKLNFAHSFYIDDIQHGYFAYGHHLQNANITVHSGLQYINYGTFQAADEFGIRQGTFQANEYAWTLGAAMPVYDKLTAGVNFRMINSQLESYDSWGIAADIGLLYSDTAHLRTVGLVFKNMGGQLTAYEGSKEDIPFDVAIAISQRLRHLPFRLTLIYHHLHQENITYDDPNSEETSFFLGEQEEGDNSFGDAMDNFARHFIINGEFLLGKRELFQIRFGYNHFRNREMKVSNFRSLAGFSFGLGLYIKKFQLSYAHEFLHLAGGSNHLSISTALTEWNP